MKSLKWSGISRTPWFHTLTVTYTIVNLYCPTNLQERIAFISENIAWVKRYKIDGNNLLLR